MIDWNDNAKAAVKYFADWAKLADNGLLDVFMQGISANTQTKTVADAAGRCNHEWVSAENEYVKGASICTKCKTIADTATVEQEGEKWTHTYTHFQPCKIEIEKPDEHGCIVIYVQGDGYITCAPEEIKPIKPTISEDAVSKLRAYANWTAGQESGYVSELIEEFIATHDII